MPVTWVRCGCSATLLTAELAFGLSFLEGPRQVTVMQILAALQTIHSLARWTAPYNSFKVGRHVVQRYITLLPYASAKFEKEFSLV